LVKIGHFFLPPLGRGWARVAGEYLPASTAHNVSLAIIFSESVVFSSSQRCFHDLPTESAFDTLIVPFWLFARIPTNSPITNLASRPPPLAAK
jgi:hypothetical protein